jgi:hypothetical protein
MNVPEPTPAMVKVVGVPLGVPTSPRRSGPWGNTKGVCVLRRVVSVLKMSVKEDEEKEFVPN